MLLNVYVIPDGSVSSANNYVARIRVVDPLMALATRGVLVQYHDGQWSEEQATVILAQRACFPSVAACEVGLRHLEAARQRGARVVYELDDDLFCDEIPALIARSAIDELDPGVYRLYQAHRAIAEVADHITCSTRTLAIHLGEMGLRASIHIVPLGLDFSNRRWPTIEEVRRRRRSPRKIGWSGGSRLGTDLEILPEVVARAFERHRDLQFVYRGPTKYRRLFSGIAERVEWRPWLGYDQYPRAIQHDGIALIPLEDNKYNRCKTALKAVEYAAVGCPAICSVVTPYAEEGARDAVCAFGGDVDAWLDGIAEALSEPRERSVARAERVRVAHGVDRSAAAYWELLQRVAGAAA